MDPSTLKIIKLAAALFGLALAANAQSINKPNPDDLLGSWGLSKQVFLIPSDDSTEIRKGNEGIILSFTQKGTFTTKQRAGNTILTLGTGSYSVSEDGKSLIQDDRNFAIMKLSISTLILRIEDDGVELHFKKLPPTK